MIKSLFKSAAASFLIAFCTGTNAIPSSSNPLPGANMGIAYMLPGSQEIYGQNYDVYMHPASTQKILTALAAYLYLGTEYRIRTALMLEKNAVNPQGKLNKFRRYTAGKYCRAFFRRSYSYLG